jgi:hypothetical protein
MPSRDLKTFVAVAACIVIAAPALAAGRSADPECKALEHSVLPAPSWYAARCLGGAAVTDYSRYTVRDGLVPGDLAFYKNNAPAPLNLKTAPLATLSFTVVGPNVQPLFAMTFDRPATTLYAVDNTSRQLGTLNQATGVFTPIAAINPDPGAGFVVTGLAFDPTSTNVYFTATDGASANLYRINLTNAALTFVGTSAGFEFIVDIAIDRTGQLYAHEIATSQLLRLDKTTAAATVVGPTGLVANFGQGMMYDNSDDTLYGCVFVVSPALQGELVRFNKTTGAATVVAGPVPDELECAVRVPAAVSLLPADLAVDAAGNGVLQPNEPAVIVAPSWRNPNTIAVGPVTGVLSNLTGPVGPTYTINDNAAAYGTIAANASASCGSNCYAVTVSAATRPAQHWDATADETITPAAPVKTWRLHVGDSFTDVPPSNIFYRFIETIIHRDVTGGCGATTYCPTANTTREQMAVFVLVSKQGSGYTPPACIAGAETFNDVPATSPFCRFIEELSRRGVVSGCGGGAYCPTAPATREQMSVFVLRTLDPALNPPACVAGSEMFVDVPAANAFCRWIEELARRGIVTGCGGGAYCPTASVTREQMSVFLSGTFSLTLYGVN